jgi:hypothetical protein
MRESKAMAALGDMLDGYVDWYEAGSITVIDGDRDWQLRFDATKLRTLAAVMTQVADELDAATEDADDDYTNEETP